MNRKLSVIAVFLVMLGVACGSFNRVLPSEVDATAMKADVRGKIVAAGHRNGLAAFFDGVSGIGFLHATGDRRAFAPHVTAAGFVFVCRRLVACAAGRSASGLRRGAQRERQTYRKDQQRFLHKGPLSFKIE